MESPNRVISWLIEQDSINKILQEFDIKNLDRKTYGKILHDENYSDAQRSKLANAVNEAGGYDVLTAA